MTEIDKPRFPSHTELYKDFHKIEENVVRQLFDDLSLGFFDKYDVQFEQYGWDIVIIINYSDSVHKRAFYIEYKSSIEEWGKKIDDYFRQIHTRINRTNPFKKEGVTQHFILMSFDPRFEEWREACKRTQFELVILPNEFLKKLNIILKTETPEERKIRKDREEYFKTHPNKREWEFAIDKIKNLTG